MRPETVAGVANDITAGSPRGQALAKLADEMGVEPAGGPAELLAALHQKLAGYDRAVTSLDEVPGVSHLEKLLISQAKKATAGIAGSALGAMVGHPWLGGAAGRMIGELAFGASSEARTELVDRVRRVVARGAGGTSKAIQRLRPVTAWLARDLNGKNDAHGSMTERAQRRAAELANAGITAPDTIYAGASRPLSQIPGGLSQGVHQAALTALTTAAQSAPKDPGTTPYRGGSDWQPSPQQAVELAYRLEALHTPLDSVQRLLAGDIHPAAVQQLTQSWPAIMQTVQGELAGRSWSNGAAAILGSPTSGVGDPLNTTLFQRQYMPPPTPPAQPGGTRPGGAPLGRPPKVGQVSAAGSNVDALLSQ
jgi:hypothetical protein